MNISVNWLRELAPGLQGSPWELADRLSMTAVPVDAVQEVGAELSEIVVARVLETAKHPNADRLTLCRVDAGGPEPIDVVCGAPVIERGGCYPYVPPGVTLPGGFRIEIREIRGQVSQGMLCSEHELGLGKDRGGIMKLESGAEVGRSLADLFGFPDTRLVLDLTPNRVDLACHIGVARELAPGGAAEIRPRTVGSEPWVPSWQEGSVTARAAGVDAHLDDPERCARYLGAVVRGVTVGPSPAWLAGRLRAIGIRPINNVVDATNYVLFERNQPLHAFDLARLKGPVIRVRTARPEERLRTLDGEDRALDAPVTVIADAKVPIALAGVMGGEATQVTAGTRDLFIECAVFSPGHVRATVRSLGLPTDASYRFERGIDATHCEEALQRCVELILALAGGAAEPEALRLGERAPVARRVGLRPERVRRLLGMERSAEELMAILEPLGFEPEEAASRDAAEPELIFRVPGWRMDVTREADLLEEVARRHGYDNFPREDRRFRASAVPADPAWAKADRVRRLLVGAGLFEARSSSFVPQRQPGGCAEIRILNPLSVEEGYLRGAIVPVLLRCTEHNFSRGRRDVRLFELGTVFGRGEDLSEELRVGLVVTGRRRPRHWSSGDADFDLWDLKGLAEDLAERLCGAGIEPMGEPGEDEARLGGDWLDSGALRIVRGGRPIGIAGRVREDAMDAPPWAGATWAVEFRLDEVEVERDLVYERISSYPAVRRDLAITVPADVPAADVEREIRQAAPAHLEWVELFDVYAGKGVEAGRRSLAWAFRFRHEDRTLTDEEVESAMVDITSRLKQQFDARVRSS
ncbi:MAG: phenylalanine--tRNA ligase subunit beta [Gemmatimonadota bacterium]